MLIELICSSIANLMKLILTCIYISVVFIDLIKVRLH
jgi:hypothetical protein